MIKKRHPNSRDQQPVIDVTPASMERLPIDQRSFQGADPRGRSTVLSAAAGNSLEQDWRTASTHDRRAVVIKTDWLTSTGTVAITLRVADGDGLEFEPGQFIGIRDDGGHHRTPYCILSAPGGGETFRLLVRVVAQGPLSRYLVELDEGASIRFRGPTGRTMLPREQDTELVLMATGVGISPFCSLSRHLLTTGADRSIRLFWGLRLEDDICLIDELEELRGRFPNFTYQISLSQPGPGWKGLRGRLSQTAPELIGDLAGKHFYLCGNGEMTSEMSTALLELGVHESLVHEEIFFNRRRRPDPAAVSAIRARFRVSGLSPVLGGEGELFPLERSRVRRSSSGSGSRPPSTRQAGYR